MRVAILTTDNREHHRRYDLSDPYFGPAIEALLQGLSRNSSLEVHVISCTQKTMRVPEKLADNISFHLLHVPKIGWLRTGYQGCIRAIRRKLREIQPDLVHGQGTERECGLGAVFSGFPNVVTLHGIMTRVAQAMAAPPGSYYWCAALLERFTLPRTRGVLCNSLYTQSFVKQFAKKTWHVPNAIRRGFFDTPLSIPIQADKAIILNVGIIAPYKRQIEILDVLEAIHRNRTDFEVRFIGAANERETYASAFLRRLDQARHFASHMTISSVTDLIAAYDSAAALVHGPSEEAFGLVVAEALARSLKFFGSNVGGISDIAAGVDGAELFALGDQGMQKAIERWLDAGCPRPQTAAAEMRGRYHPDLIAQRHIEIYREVLQHAR